MSISVNANVGQQHIDTSRAPESVRTSGTFMGRTVSAPKNMASLVADAMEELTAHVAETKSQKLNERSKTKRQESRLIDSVKKYQELIDKEEFAGEARKLSVFISQMMQKASGGAQSADDAYGQIQEYLGKSGRDVTEQYALLAEVLETAPPDSEQAKVVSYALQQMESRQGGAIAAGLHAASEAAEYAEIGDSQQLRDTYRSTVLDFENSRSVFDQLLQQYGAEKIDQALEFLFATLARDIDSVCPTMDKARMEVFSTDMNKVRDIASLYGLSGRLLERLESEHNVALPQTEAGNNVAQMMDRFLQMMEQKFPAPMDVHAIMDPLNIPDTTRKVLFLQDTLKETKMLPVKVFESLESRDKILQLVQQELDSAIEREDEELGY
ncbi:type III secretion system gatekeeper subunit SctW [Halodesulfovibrio spirochaetisodalis]|uniref:YopN family type III secretion system gatekeeper subunit n=1 Tax=Halodesulfovibrio spirochaetisodalis TaxID=1560234 RepID=A0A1B7X9D5_9BACT|nr:type III secretion system gatekeeper subunit SctW [Halodesulfovibrio spirochaetisodalis]OBQ45957.1 hypothetical protein SP90_15175 [Halodesulfovibrio spirochaetisodalis]